MLAEHDEAWCWLKHIVHIGSLFDVLQNAQVHVGPRVVHSLESCGSHV